MTMSTLEDEQPRAGSPTEAKTTPSTARPPVTFFSLPRELRDEIYKLVLIIHQRVEIFAFRDGAVRCLVPPIPRLYLLRACHQIRNETQPLVYRLHRFYLDNSMASGQLFALQSFLDRIGPANSACLSDLQMYFPSYSSAAAPMPDPVADDRPPRILNADCIRLLGLLRDQCSSLRTLELSVAQQNSKGLADKTLDVDFMRDVVAQTHQHLQGIASLQMVVVPFYFNAPAAATVERMKSLGWIMYNYPNGRAYPGHLC